MTCEGKSFIYNQVSKDVIDVKIARDYFLRTNRNASLFVGTKNSSNITRCWSRKSEGS